MIYYGFDEITRGCVFSASTPVEAQPGIVVVGAEDSYDIQDIGLVWDGATPTIAQRIVSPAELVAAADQEKARRLAQAAVEIAVLADVVEFSDPTKSELLISWRRYRAQVYVIDTSKPAEILWPNVPGN